MPRLRTAALEACHATLPAGGDRNRSGGRSGGPFVVRLKRRLLHKTFENLRALADVAAVELWVTRLGYP
jgi:hypothetical protein